MTAVFVGGPESRVARMAAKKSSPTFEFTKKYLQRRPSASFTDVQAAAQKKGLKVIPVVYGRAKKLLGLAKPATAKKKKAKKVAKRGRPAKTTARRGRPPKSATSAGALMHGHTFCGTPLGASVAREVLAIYREEAVLDAARPKAAKIADAILAMRRNDQDREQLRKALERIREIVDSALS